MKERRTENTDTEQRREKGKNKERKNGEREETQRRVGHTVSQISNLISLFSPSSVSVVSVWVKKAAPI
jgi:hypothetical protein